MEIPFGLTRAIAPAFCDQSKTAGPGKERCPLNSYRMNTDKCEFIDQQIIKLQEAPELIPTGEMPRHVLMTCDRQLTDKCTPGNRVKVVGILSITKKSGATSDTNSNKQIRNHVQRSYIKALGLQSVMNDDGSPSSMGFSMPLITDEDKEKFESMKKDS